jgi:predicted chitinase
MRAEEFITESSTGSNGNIPQWVDLGDISVEDKISIFESYYADGIMLESDNHNVEYFKGLSRFSVDPKKDLNYVVVPLLLIQNRVIPLSAQLLELTFVGRTDNQLIFSKENSDTIKFPSDYPSKQGITHTFVFDNPVNYDAFRSEVMLKFNLQLPELNSTLDEDWRHVVTGLGAASMLAGGGSAAYDAYKAQQQTEPQAHVQQVQQPQAKIQAPVAKAQPQVTQAQAVSHAQDLLATKGAQILQRAAKTAGLKGAELAQFMAQCAHETANFSTLTEFGDRNYFKKYDIRFNPEKAKILGNLRPGDGERYKGRGFIQLTGRDNYKRAGQALGLPLEQKPELVERPDVAAKVAVWFWQNRVQPQVSNFNDTAKSTKPINPGLKGLQDRHNKFTGMKVAMAKPTTLAKVAKQAPAAKVATNVAAKPAKQTKISKVTTKPTKGKKV